MCGLPGASLVTIRDPTLVPSAAGRNTTSIGQLAPPATEVPQGDPPRKSLESLAIPAIESSAVPELVSVTVCGALLVRARWPGNASQAGRSVTADADAMPR